MVSKDFSRYGKLQRGNKHMEKMAISAIPYVLDQTTWNPDDNLSGVNEALVDNWKVVGFVQAPWDTEDEELMDNELYVAGDNLGIPLLTVNDINKGMY